ncbi:hypothetical protein Nmel_012077 [Mimus melanotis]
MMHLKTRRNPAAKVMMRRMGRIPSRRRRKKKMMGKLMMEKLMTMTWKKGKLKTPTTGK